MSTVTTPAPAEIDTLQGIERFAEKTGQDFFDLLLDRLEVLDQATATDLHDAAQHIGVPASVILQIADQKSIPPRGAAGAGPSLQRLRTTVGLSIQEVAQAAGTSTDYLSRVEADQTWYSRLFVRRVARAITEQI